MHNPIVRSFPVISIAIRIVSTCCASPDPPTPAYRQPLSLLPVTGQARVEAALDDKGLGPNRESPAVRLTLSHEMEVKGARTVEVGGVGGVLDQALHENALSQ
jgi:hypothetical protein